MLIRLIIDQHMRSMSVDKHSVFTDLNWAQLVLGLVHTQRNSARYLARQ